MHIFCMTVNFIPLKNILSLSKSLLPLGHLKLPRSTLCKHSKGKPIAIYLKTLKPPEKIFLEATKCRSNGEVLKKYLYLENNIIINNFLI